MTERELFDAIGRLPEPYRTEAFAPEQDDRQPNEIDALFDSAARTEAMQYRKEPVPEAAERRPAGTIRQSVQQKPQKSGIFGLSVIAAAVALTVGIFAWKMRQDSDMQSNPAAKGTSDSAEYVQESDISAKHVTSSADGDSQQGADTEHSAVLSEDSRYTDDTQEDFENFLGGHGRLKTVMNYGRQLILEDQDYWYVSGARRISKTARNADDRLYGELLCMTPGCTHTDNRCPYYNFNNRLLSDGTDLYWCEESYERIERKLLRLSDNGEWEDFFTISRGAVYDTLSAAYERAFPEQVNDIGATESIDYYGIVKLGSFGYYLSCGLVYRDAPQFLFGILLDQNADAFALLPISSDAPVYDDVHGMLYLPRPWTALSGALQQINAYDLSQVTLSAEAQDTQPNPAMILGVDCTPQCCTADGKLFYFSGSSEKERDLICIEPTFSSDDSKTMQLRTEKIESNTNKTNLMSADGRLYYTVNVRTGKDRLFTCLPDLTQEEVLYETPNTILRVYPVTDPSFIRLETDTGVIFLADGKAERIDTADYS